MRMRSLSLPVITAVALVGCAPNPRVQGVEPAGPPPLRVWIGYPIGSSQSHPIYVNRESHVAMFEIIPGRGVTMVYPLFREHTIASEWHSADLMFQPGRMFYYSDAFGYATFQLRYYYAIASAAPLNIARLQASVGSMRRVLGRMYGSFRPYDVIDRITELVVPMQTDADWATDLFVDWPGPPPPRSVLGQQWIQCSNGRVLLVASSYPYFGCPGDRPVAIVANGSPPPPVKDAPLDSITRPRLPGGDNQRPSGGDVPVVDKRRRAEPGARTPGTRGTARAASPTGATRYSDQRRSGGSSSRPQPTSSPTSTSAPAPSSTERSQPVDRGDSRAQPAPERGESRAPRKPPQ